MIDRGDVRYAEPGGELCFNCGHRYQIIFNVSMELWRKIWQEADDSDPDDGHLCPVCFDRLAWGRGVTLRWEAKPE